MAYLFIAFTLGIFLVLFKNDIKNKKIADVAQYLMTISAVFIGLYTTFRRSSIARQFKILYNFKPLLNIFIP
jgi:hypothetical protein